MTSARTILAAVAAAIVLADAVSAWSAGRTDASAHNAEEAPRITLAQRARKTPAAADTLPTETIEADVSTRTIAVTSGFTGSEIVLFGSVLNSRQTSAEAGYYDVIVVLEAAATPLLARRKSNVAGIWVNTRSVAFEGAPSYYAVVSPRPIEEIADDALLERHAIGLDFVRLAPAARSVIESEPEDLKAFKQAVVRLKQKEGLYRKEDYGVIFLGQSLFRSSIVVPANVPVGPLTARVYLFRTGELLSTFTSRVRFEREGIELWLYRFAMRRPMLYGLFAVFAAVAAGLIASALFRSRKA